MDLQTFRKKPVIGILRGIEEEMLESLSRIIVSTGLKYIEITMNTESAPELLRKMVHLSEGQFELGAGTVTSMQQLNLALGAGAKFIVMPVMVREIVEFCVHHKIPVFPGALTPQEVFDAWNAGATMVKVFPAKVMGPGYFNELKGPFNEIELLACGGINSENVKAYFDNKVSGVAFGASIFDVQKMKNGDYKSIEIKLSQFMEQII